jgi:hypothetical protein
MKTANTTESTLDVAQSAVGEDDFLAEKGMHEPPPADDADAGGGVACTSRRAMPNGDQAMRRRRFSRQIPEESYQIQRRPVGQRLELCLDHPRHVLLDRRKQIDI